MNGLLLAVDPGIDQGWAIYDLSSRLLLASGLGLAPTQSFAQVVIEKPKIYNSGTAKANPDSIIKLAFKVGKLLERYATSEIYLVEPGTWKGQLNKKVCHDRLREKLTAQELATIQTSDHNVWDAIAIGKWAIGRSSLDIFRYRG